MNSDQRRDTLGAFGERPSALQVWSVSGLCMVMAQLLQARFGSVIVQGEISGFVRAGSGHCYFNLKDESGQLRCAMFKRHAASLDFMPQDGNLVRVRARIDLYGPRGDLQLIVEGLEKAGLGPLLERFNQLKTRLHGEGLFDSARKRPLLAHPRAIGLITSLGAAALRDVAIALARRVPHIPVVLVNAKVQGAQAPEELISALEQLSAYPGGVDVVLMVRGGGSIEDLWAFNDEALARALAAYPVPVVTGIGHETDFTIADFVADLRAPTPTAAAELVATSLADRLSELDTAQQVLAALLQRQLDVKEQVLDRAGARLGRPSDVVHRQAGRLTNLAYALSRTVNAQTAMAQRRVAPLAGRWPDASQRYIAACQQRLDRAQVALQHLDPKNVLARGYALLTNSAGQAMTQAAHASVGQPLTAILVDGQLDFTVTGRQVHSTDSPAVKQAL